MAHSLPSNGVPPGERHVPRSRRQEAAGNGPFPGLPFLGRTGNALAGSGERSVPGRSAPFPPGNKAFPALLIDTPPVLLVLSPSLGGRQEGTTLGP